MRNKCKRVFALLLALSILSSLAVSGVSFFSSAAAGALPIIGSTKAIQVSTGVFIQSYISIEKGVSTDISVFDVDKLDVYGFEASAGGDKLDVKKYAHEVSMGAADDSNRYSTWTVDPNAVPYQAYEVDVTNVTGEIIIGFQGATEDINGTLVMQIYDPAEGKYFEVATGTSVSGVINMAVPVSAQQYAENGRLRYRVTIPSDSSDKWIYMNFATAGKMNTDIQYGNTKTRTSSGNTSLNYKGEIGKEQAFVIRATNENGTAYSIPLYFAERGPSNQSELVHFVMNFGATQTSRNLTWTTVDEMPTFVQVVPYGPLEPDFSQATVFEGVTEKFSGNFKKNFEHYVTIDGLELGKEYWYRYGNGDDVWSSPCYLRVDDGDDVFSFIVGGDPQPEEPKATEEEAEEKMGKKYVQMMYSINEAVSMVGAEFILNCGDTTDSGNIELCWDWYFKSNLPYFRTMPLASTMGNHDSWGYEYWLRKHNYPDLSGMEGGHGSYYSFDYGNAHFVVINGNIAPSNDRKELTDMLVAWLENDLMNTDKEFKIIMSHQGMYSYPVHTYDQETVEMRPIITALIDKYDVDIMFQGHDHIWLRTNEVEGGKKVTNTDTIVDIVSGERITYLVDPEGTTYTNAGSFTGSKYHNPDPTKYSHIVSVACASQPQRPTFTTVEIENGRLSLKGWVRDASGSCKRISEYTCYGDTKQDGLNILKTSFYDDLADRIDALPEDITIENKAEVIALKTICDRESETIIGRYIPGYEKVVSAAATIEELERLANAVPEITVNGEIPSEWETGKPLDLPAATAYDENDGSVEVSVSVIGAASSVEVIDGKCTFVTPGSYTVKYSATDADGHTVEKEYAIEVILGTKKGDLDGDGEITVADALVALRIAARMAQATEQDMLIGDIDLDGEITVSDALAILRVAARMTDEL